MYLIPNKGTTTGNVPGLFFTSVLMHVLPLDCSCFDARLKRLVLKIWPYRPAKFFLGHVAGVCALEKGLWVGKRQNTKNSALSRSHRIVVIYRPPIFLHPMNLIVEQAQFWGVGHGFWFMIVSSLELVFWFRVHFYMKIKFRVALDHFYLWSGNGDFSCFLGWPSDIHILRKIDGVRYSQVSHFWILQSFCTQIRLFTRKWIG